MHETPVFEDTTLREGEQAPGVAFNREIKIKIHDLLVDAGVKWIEVGTPAMGGEELNTIREIIARGSDAMLLGWNRGTKEDLNLSLSIGLKAVHIGLPVSSIHLRDSLNRTKKWLLTAARDLVAYAKDKGAYVSISAEDIGRAETGFLQEYAAIVTEAGADRLRLSDTLGTLAFHRFEAIIRKITSVSDIDLHCHMHNDFGLAVANTIAGIRAGARFFHATLNGIGERAGIADAVQLIMSLKKLYRVDIGIDPQKMIAAAEYVRTVIGTRPYPWAPLVGDNVFAHESGIHVRGMLQNPETFEPIAPEEVGGKRRYVLGKHSGRTSIRYFLAQSNIEPSDEELSLCLELVKQRAIENLGEVSREELLELYWKTKGSFSTAVPCG